MPGPRYHEIYEKGTGKLLSQIPFTLVEEATADAAEVAAARRANLFNELDEIQARLPDKVTDWKAQWKAANNAEQKLTLLAKMLRLI